MAGMSAYSFLIAWLVPGLPALAGLCVARARPQVAGRLVAVAAWSAFALALVAAAGLFAPGAARPGTAGLWVDGVAVIMAVMVAFLGAVIVGFARRYLAGDPGQSRFLAWMSLTLASVLLLVLAGHMLLLLAAWITTSLCLHRLLLFYPERAGARFAARKKFVFSRLGDACLLGAAAVLYNQHQTFDLAAIAQAVADGHTAGNTAAALLLAACAMLKSAQFPFHSWLPDTMDTPTPVSAFMHAGIINAGGFLVIRLAPVLAASPLASGLLAVVGAFTAAFGAIVMLAQPSVKRALAYSTIAQMGFMLLQCGLGAYGLALLHIAAHSLYKAHAFLTAGSTIGALPRAAVPLRTPALVFGVIAGAVLVTAGAFVVRAVTGASALHSGVFAVVLASALAYGLARTWSVDGARKVLAHVILAALAVAVLSLALHFGASRAFAGFPQPQPPQWLLVAVGTVFVGLFLFQALLWRANRSAVGRRLYVHALNGFYIGTWFNRALGRLWPQHPVAS
jgi:NAD(P)H-quinone oxidoreductase subunit 5